MTRLRLSLLLACSVVAGTSLAEDLPTLDLLRLGPIGADQHTSVFLEGIWFDTCAPDRLSFHISEGRIDLELESPSLNVGCGDMITDWSIDSGDVGPLTLGATYDVFGSFVLVDPADREQRQLFGDARLLMSGWRASVAGDYDGDHLLTATDMDTLTYVIHRQDDWFDLNGDGSVDDSDRHALIVDLMNTYIGDANMDGGFSTADWVQVFLAGEYEDGIPRNSTWSEGDFTGDGEFTSSDFVATFMQFPGECGPRDGARVCWDYPGPGKLPDPVFGSNAWYGDLNLDNRLDAADIDLLSAVVRDGDVTRANDVFLAAGFDLNGDGAPNSVDRVIWVEDLKMTYIGDANLDGACTSTDLIVAFLGGKYDTDEAATWREGDWNGDLKFDSADFLYIFLNGCSPGQGPRPARSVPEPGGIGLVFTGLILCLVARKS